jgi:hypothetical protein
VVPPPLEAPNVTVEAGPSAWFWRPRVATSAAPEALLHSNESTSLDATRPGCATGDRFYAPMSDGRCVLREQALFALTTQTRFAGAPRRHDGSDLAALLRPSLAAGEPDADVDAQRNGAQRARATTFVDDREASWCSFTVEGVAPRATLRAQCALDRLDLYTGAAPRVDRAQSCGVDRVESCADRCESNEDCGEQTDCGCEQSRCVRGRCTACAPRRVCAEPTFTTRATSWVLRAPLAAADLDLARALAARPAAFRTILHFAVTSASRDVRARPDRSVEYDSGYRLQIRPLALSAALCAGECRQSTRAALSLFAAPQWQTRVQGLQVRCASGQCSAVPDAAAIGDQQNPW